MQKVLTKNKEILRVIDANLNRAREGARVCEEVTRFIINNKTLTKEIKSARHRIQAIYESFPNGWKIILSSRDSKKDVGKECLTTEMNKKNVTELFSANMQRTKEAIRVLEEFTKLTDHRLSKRFKTLRFNLYEIEKKTLTRL